MRSFLIVLLLIALSPKAFLQTTEFTIEPKQMTKGVEPSFSFDLPGSKLKDIETLWGKYVSRGTKEKIQNNKGEWTMIGAVDRNISASPFYIYATMLETIKGVRMTTFFSENNVFIGGDSTAQDKILAVKKYLFDFSNLVKIDQLKAEISAEEKILKEQDKNMKSLQNTFDKSVKSASESQRKIEKNEAEIKRIEREIDLKNGQIAQQKDVILKLANALGDEKKVAQKTLKGLEKDKSNLYKQKEKMAKEIDNCNANIRNEERTQSKLKGEKDALQSEIDKQNEKIRGLQDKLASIPDPGIKL